MKICHVCNAECEDFDELCFVCGADLTVTEDEAEVTSETEKEEILLKDPVMLVTIEDVVSAEIFKDILKDNNIIYASEEKEDGGAMQVLFGGGFVACNIYVESKDYEAADKLYYEFLETEQKFEEDFYIEEDSTEESEE